MALSHNELDVAKIRAPSEEPEDAPDEKAYQEQEYLQEAKLRQWLLDRNQDREERKRYAKYLYIMIAAWLGVVAIVLLLHGFGSVFGFFAVPDNVLVTLLGGTTLNVLGLFVLVARYLFSEKRLPHTESDGPS